MHREEDSPRGDWDFIDPDGDLANSLLSELRKEVSRGHPLWRAKVTVLARRWSQDDILVAVADRPGVCSVHLVWQGRQRPPYPRTQWFASAELAVEHFGNH